MHFLHPGFLWLAPLVALPIIIHLLNRIRYRRVRWAAIDFLLTSERRAVRRAKLKHLLLMALRTLLLAAALGVLLQPILRGSLASLLGNTSRLAVMVDSSASMSVSDAQGAAFQRAKELAAQTLVSLPHGTRATAGTFSLRYDSPFREPLLDREAVASVLDEAKLTAGASDVPAAILAAAEALQRGGGGGTVWILTDMQASAWRAGDSGAWEKTRRALEDAGRPAVVVTDLAPSVDANFSVEELRSSPAVLVEGDAPKLVASVRLNGKSGGVTHVSLFFDGQRVDSRVVELDEPGRAEVVFHLPALKSGTHWGYVELSADAVPGDNRCWFTLRAGERIPLVIVDGAPSSVPFAGASDFLALAVRPPEVDDVARSPFEAKVITLDRLASVDLRGVAAVLLADVPRIEGENARVLDEYLRAGGLAMVFPGAHADVPSWNAGAIPGVPVGNIVEAREKEAFKVNWTWPSGPVVASLPAEGLDRLRINRLYRLDAKDARVLATTASGDPFLVQRQVARGKLYLFAVSCQEDFSNLPFTPVLLLTVHRAVASHLVEVGEPLSQPAFTALHLPMPPVGARVRLPDGDLVPLRADPESPHVTTFERTDHAGIYRLVEGELPPEKIDEAPILAAINPPVEESELDRINEGTVHELLGGTRVSILRAEGGSVQQLGTGGAQQSAASSFPLAAIAVMLLAGEVVLGWLIDRPVSSSAPLQPGEVRRGD